MEKKNLLSHVGNMQQRSIMGGLLFTCGLENIGGPCSLEGKEYPMHGRIRTTPAEHVGADICRTGEDYTLTLTGELREAELFGENIVLRRKITTVYGEHKICIEDRISNEGFRREPMMLLYHINAGYPLLSEKSRIILPTRKVRPRDELRPPIHRITTGWSRRETMNRNTCFSMKWRQIQREIPLGR